MFSEYREIVTELKTSDAHFQNVFNKHNELDDELSKVEVSGNDTISPHEIERMKKEKLKLKDEAFAMIMDYKQKA